MEEVTKKQRADKIVHVITGLAHSKINIVIFNKDDPEIWFQFYMGLYLGMPTIVQIDKRYLPLKTMMNKYPLVKRIIEVEKYDDTAITNLADTILEVNKEVSKYDSH